MAEYYIGVDVGTGSVRAGLFSSDGRLLATASHGILIHQPGPAHYYEQSSQDIWQAVAIVTRAVTSDVDKSKIRGLGFDATCSLVVLGEDFLPLAVSQDGEAKWNIIMWMDHRAAEQASFINTTKHHVLSYVGGSMSPEMQVPKLLWIKQNLKSECWDRARHFFDLPDYLTWRATGSLSRSLCSLVCKWTYMADNKGNQGWSDEFLTLVGLEDLTQDSYSKIGQVVLSPGQECGRLTEVAAAELGLLPNIPVSTSIVDAHAGGLGTLGCIPRELSEEVPLTCRLALICGTSTCHMAVSEAPCFVPGVWGPYFSAMVPQLWLNEGGQSASGKLIDHVVETHAAYPQLKKEAETKSTHVHAVLNAVLETVAQAQAIPVSHLTRDLHVWPDFHGNRSPLANPNLKGMISGLTLESGIDNLACLYLATIQALAYGTRHIIQSMADNGYNIKWLYMCGGLRKNPLFVQTHADVLGIPIICPDTTESVVLGSAILAACASKKYPSVQDAMQKMGGEGSMVLPDLTAKQYHDNKYAVFLKMVEHQQIYRSIMEINKQNGV